MSQAVEAVLSGTSIRKAAAFYNVAKSSLHRRLNFGKTSILTEAVNAIRGGKSVEAVAHLYNIPSMSLLNYMNKNAHSGSSDLIDKYSDFR